MAAKRTSCNLTKYIKVGADRWQYCPVVRGKTGRLKQDIVMVDGRAEHHSEGQYALDWREGGKRRRVAVGKNAGTAQQEQERQNTVLKARPASERRAQMPTAAAKLAPFVWYPDCPPWFLPDDRLVSSKLALEE